ncbi:kynureninase-like [Tubulanus polymorphus]|uniref:kynureninase-like n=1 Tax=Tubulanus polymorphus TaxID=672921 RepID=UPI003DA514CA
MSGSEIVNYMDFTIDDVKNGSNLESPVKKKGKFDPHGLSLSEIAEMLGCDLDSVKFARYMDNHDRLKHLRNEYYYPKNKTLIGIDLCKVDLEEDSVYFCGNSLGLQPRGTNYYIQKELDKWAKIGVQGHVNGDLPWAHCDEKINARVARLVGGNSDEVQLMNGLTVNLHFLLISFYRPTPQRHKILLESKAFPSDHYAIESQIRLHGFDPESSMICLEPRQGEFTLRTEDILARIASEGDSIAVVCLSGVQYYTGQLFDMAAITKAGQEKGCYVGFDLAHAVGNVEIHLHDWNVDFACWCTYKYLNASAGGIAGAFLHERHMHNDFPKLLGWWGHEGKTRFVMDNDLKLSPGIDGYRVSNPPPLLVCPLIASIDIFEKTSMEALRAKSKQLTGYLEILLLQKFPKPSSSSPGETIDNKPYIEIITPSDPDQRGCQLSVKFSVPIKNVFKELVKRGVVCDEREPDVIRLAPTPMYNKFEDVYRFIHLLEHSLADAAKYPPQKTTTTTTPSTTNQLN